MPHRLQFFSNPAVNATTLFSIFLLGVCLWLYFALGNHKIMFPSVITDHIHTCSKYEIEKYETPSFLIYIEEWTNILTIGISLSTALNHLTDFIGKGIRLRYQVAIVAETMFVATIIMYSIFSIKTIPIYLCHNGSNHATSLSTVNHDDPQNYKYEYARSSFSVLRYIYWFSTSPSMLAMQSHISSLTIQQSTFSIILQMFVILFGGISSIFFLTCPHFLYNPLQHDTLPFIIAIGWITLSLSCLCFIGVIYYLIQGLIIQRKLLQSMNKITNDNSNSNGIINTSNNGMQNTDSSQDNTVVSSSPNLSLSSLLSTTSFTTIMDKNKNISANTIRKEQITMYLQKLLSILAVILWLCFPIIWFLGTFFIINRVTEAVLFCITDVITKILFTIIWLTADCTMMDNIVLQQLQDINNQKQQVGVLDRTRKDILRYIVHELRIPLNTIYLGLEELLRIIPTRNTISRISNSSIGIMTNKETTDSNIPPLLTNLPITSGSQSSPLFKHEQSSEQRTHEEELDTTSTKEEGVSPSNAEYRTTATTPTLTPLPTVSTTSNVIPSSVSSIPSVMESTDELFSTPTRLISSLLNNVATIQAFVNDLLSLERIQAGKLDLEKTYFTVDTILNEIETLFLAPLLAKEITFEKLIVLLPYPGREGTGNGSTTGLSSMKNITINSWNTLEIMKPHIQVYGDINKIRQIICNLLSNSIKFTSQGGHICVGVWIPITVNSLVLPSNNILSSPSTKSTNLSSSTVPETTSTTLTLPIIIHNIRNPHENTLFPVSSTLYYSIEQCSKELPSLISPDIFRVTVVDNGTGIKEDDIPKLFKPFSQINPTLLQSGQGSGLGLSICKQIIELSGGTINVLSKINYGSVFYFDLPKTNENLTILPKVNHHPQQQPLTIKKISSRSTLSTSESDRKESSETKQLSFIESVAVVDDSETNRLLFGHLLQHHGVKSICYGTNGIDILNKLSSHNESELISSSSLSTTTTTTTPSLPCNFSTIQVWFIDLNMPFMDGLELIHQLRTKYHIAVPCILVTGDVDNDDNNKEVDYKEVTAILSKPVTTIKLAELLHTLGLTWK